MKRIQIENTNNAAPEAEEVVIGIDLGTTNSLSVVYEKEDEPRILCDVLPSVVTFFENGSVEIGNLQNSKTENSATISSIKRLIGKENGTVQAFGKTYTPEEISAFILKEIKDRSEKTLGKPISKAVITVPAYFDDTQRSATKAAAKAAGLDVLRLLNEPTAAAVFYDIENKDEGIYAVFDLGGGTFDISILQMKMGVIKVLAVGGDTELGGDDFDAALGSALEVSSFEARNIKEEICLKGESHGIGINEFDEIILHLVHKTVAIFKATLEDAEILASDLNGIILVGGSTKMPIIREALSAEFETKIFDGVDPDRIVAYGAALHAFNLQNRTGNMLLDVVPLTLGIETVGGMVLKMIPRNSLLPASQTEELTTGEDNQTSIAFHVVQGEREFAKDCRSLSFFELKGILPMPKGLAQIILSFDVDIDGILSVSAIEKLSGKEAFTQIRPSYNLNPKDVRKMFEDAMKNGKEDMKKRVIEEKKQEGYAVLEAAKLYAKAKDVKDILPLTVQLEGVLLNLQNSDNIKQLEEIDKAIFQIRDFTIGTKGNIK